MVERLFMRKMIADTLYETARKLRKNVMKCKKTTKRETNKFEIKIEEKIEFNTKLIPIMPECW